MEQHILAICEAIEGLRKDVASLRHELENKYATIERVRPLESFKTRMEGVAIAILVGVIALMVGQVIPGFRL